MDDKLVVFKGKEIRRAIHDNEWYFSVVDIIAALTDSANPRNYWNMIKNRVKKTSGVELSTFCGQLKLPASDGKTYKTDVVNTESAGKKLQGIQTDRFSGYALI